ncbi:gp28 [Listeria phage P40]|uniref:metal-dependent hydrolase n=1 Tax=Listeria phage P40 TaxID=560178 RepID=UPI00018198E2|nr:metal-dependent hydrolase [Listeria phage P40]ACI00388.1 gp28 [Listeria phage P40]
MESLDYKIVASGSSGNAVRIKNIMIDAGVPFIKMKEELYECDYLFITHHHSDHIRPSTLKNIKKYFPNIEICSNPVTAYLHDIENTVYNNQEQELKHSIVTPFQCHHDVECQGFVFEFDTGERVIYATDTNSMEDAPDGKFTHFFLEANYDEKKVRAIGDSRKKYGYDVTAGAYRHLSKKASKTFYYLRRADKNALYEELHKSKRFY